MAEKDPNKLDDLVDDLITVAILLYALFLAVVGVMFGLDYPE